MKEKIIETIKINEIVNFKKFKNYLKMSNYNESILIHIMYYAPEFTLFDFMKLNKSYSCEEILEEIGHDKFSKPKK